MNFRVDVYHHVDIDADVTRQIESALSALISKVGTIMATQAELAASLTQLSAEVQKIGTETTTLLQRVADLTAAVANAGQTTPEVDAALLALQKQAQTVDDLVPDAP